MDEPHMVVIRPAHAWVAQAKAAMAVLEEKNGGELVNIADAAKVDYGAFCSLIEAMHALTPIAGRPVSEELMELAQLRPVDEIMRDGDG
jgi:hypothetical protein